MPKGKGSKMSEAQLAALAKGRIAAKKALAEANAKRKAAAMKGVPQVTMSHIKMPAPITIDEGTGEIVKPTRNPKDVSLKEWLDAATAVAKELGREAIESEKEWGYLRDLWQNENGIGMVLNKVLPRASNLSSINNFPINALNAVVAKVGCGSVAPNGRFDKTTIEPPFAPVWEEKA